MRPHPRIRKTVKWGGAVVCVLLVIGWIGSNWWSASYAGRQWGVSVTRGRALLIHVESGFARPVRGWILHVPQPLDAWSWIWDYESRRGFQSVSLPLWTLAVVAASPLLIGAFQRVLATCRPSVGVCRRCRYSRTGLAPSAVCPECGSAAESATDQRG